MIAREGRDVATVDLPGFFLQTDQDKIILLKVTGAVALLLVEFDSSKWKKSPTEREWKMGNLRDL